MILQKFRRLESAATDVTVNHAIGVWAVDQVVMSFGTSEAGKGLGAGQALTPDAVGQPGHSHVFHGHVIGLFTTCNKVQKFQTWFSESLLFFKR
jgi:hypothetical protein